MPIYVYETIPQKAGEEPRRFELKQSMNDAPLARDPETGHPRVTPVTALTVSDVLTKVLQIPRGQWEPKHQQRVGHGLEQAGDAEWRQRRGAHACRTSAASR